MFFAVLTDETVLEELNEVRLSFELSTGTTIVLTALCILLLFQTSQLLTYSSVRLYRSSFAQTFTQ
jgi:hypothetical protein